MNQVLTFEFYLNEIFHCFFTIPSYLCGISKQLELIQRTKFIIFFKFIYHSDKTRFKSVCRLELLTLRCFNQSTVGFLGSKTDIFGVEQCQFFQIFGSTSDSPGLWGSENA